MNLPVTVNTGLASIEAGATAWIGKSRSLTGALSQPYFGVKFRRTFGETHRTADIEVDDADAIGESYVAIVHPYVAYDLRRNPEWIDVHKYAAPENIYNGEIGKLAGVRFIETSEAKIWTGSGCPSGLAVFGTLVLAAHAYAVTEVEGGGLQHIVKQLGAGEDPLNQRASVGWKAIKTAERLCEQYMVRIESISPKYSAKAKAN